MRKITETKTEEFYIISREEAGYLYKFLGKFSDQSIAEVLEVPVASLWDENHDSLHYKLWKQLDDEFDEELKDEEK